MLQQVKIINGVKTLVPLSGSTPSNEVALNNMHSVTSNAVAEALKGTVYNSGSSAINKTGGNFRTIANVPKGIYLATYGFGYVAGGNGNWRFTTTDANGVIYFAIYPASSGWLGSISTIVYLPNGGDVSFSAYNSSSSINEQSNGKGLSLVKICDV